MPPAKILHDENLVRKHSICHFGSISFDVKIELQEKQYSKSFINKQKESTMSPKKETKKSTNSATARGKGQKGLSAEEIAAMKATIKERKMAANKEEAEKAALAAIADMQEPDRSMAKRIHAIIKENAPGLLPKTWYGMPAYADKDGNVICFFQTAQKFKARYSTFGFNDRANLDEGEMWPVAFALKKLTAAEESKIAALVKKAAG
jgi:uncharacterized protein YdhG (YjbR/CyaY superfamily)